MTMIEITLLCEVAVHVFPDAIAATGWGATGAGRGSSARAGGVFGVSGAGAV